MNISKHLFFSNKSTRIAFLALAAAITACLMILPSEAYAAPDAGNKTEPTNADVLYIREDPQPLLVDETAKSNPENNQQTTEQLPEDNDALTVEGEESPTITGTAHIQDDGWQNGSTNEEDKAYQLGTTGQEKRLEAITLEIESDIAGSIEYDVHVQNYGWQDSVTSGEVAGTTGKALRIEAVQIYLTDDLANQYDIWYRAHVQNLGWLDWACNGQKAGSSGSALRLEALQIKVLAKGFAAAPTNTANAFYAPFLSGSAHVQNIGWMQTATHSADEVITIGSIGQGLRLEAFTLEFGEGAQETLPDVLGTSVDNIGSIQYKAHVQNNGWDQTYKSDGEVSGTTGNGYRVEAIQMQLVGNVANEYTVWYRVHVANIGWLGWTKASESAGTANSAVRAEAIEIRLMKHGDDSLLSSIPSYLEPSMFTATIGTKSKDLDWVEVGLGATAGTTGQGRPLLGLEAENTSDFSGSINYATHLSNIGWTNQVSDNAQSGNLGNNIEALYITLSGDAGKYFDVYYRTHVSDAGWIGWASNGGYAGSTGLSKNVEAIEVVVVVKGGAAPGSTENSFSDENGFLAPYPAYVRNMLSRAQGFSSRTNTLILVDTANCNIVIFRGSQGNWAVDTYDRCVCGAWNSPSITGTYTTGYHLAALPSYPNALYCTNISGEYFFHSILNSPSELGQHLSHGCIRLNWWLAQYVQSLPYGSTVNLY